MPSLQKARILAERVTCMTQLRNIGQAFQLYANDWNDYIPQLYKNYDNKWYVSLANPYLGYTQTGHDLALWLGNNPSFYTCTAQLKLHENSISKLSYGMNYYAGVGREQLDTLNKAVRPSQTCLVADGCFYDTGGYFLSQICPAYNIAATAYAAYPDPTHMEGDDILYMDMHVSWLLNSEIPDDGLSQEATSFWYGQ